MHQSPLFAFSRESLVDLMHELGDLSGEAILPYFRNSLDVIDKSGDKKFDPVTLADKKGEEVIRELLGIRAASHGVIGEEFDDKPAKAENDDVFEWVVDPIDGTRSFISGIPVWGTLIGLLKNSVPYLGVMNQPFTGERYWSDSKKSFYRGPQGEKKLATRQCSDLDQAILFTTDPNMFKTDAETESFEEIRNMVKLTRYGTDCYAYCQLAAGHVDVVLESSLKTYDIAALIPIIRDAGGVVTTWDGSDASKGGSILACGDPELHKKILEILN